jgi:hypothetical protein
MVQLLHVALTPFRARHRQPVAYNSIVSLTIVSEIDTLRPWYSRLLSGVGRYGIQKLTLVGLVAKTLVFADFHPR